MKNGETYVVMSNGANDNGYSFIYSESYDFKELILSKKVIIGIYIGNYLFGKLWRTKSCGSDEFVKSLSGIHESVNNRLMELFGDPEIIEGITLSLTLRLFLLGRFLIFTNTGARVSVFVNLDELSNISYDFKKIYEI